MKKCKYQGGKAITDTEKSTLKADENRIDAEKAKNSAEEAKDTEKALAKFKLEAEKAKAILKKHNDAAK